MLPTIIIYPIFCKRRSKVPLIEYICLRVYAAWIRSTEDDEADSRLGCVFYAITRIITCYKFVLINCIMLASRESNGNSSTIYGNDNEFRKTKISCKTSIFLARNHSMRRTVLNFHASSKFSRLLLSF